MMRQTLLEKLCDSYRCPCPRPVAERTLRTQGGCSVKFCRTLALAWVRVWGFAAYGLGLGARGPGAWGQGLGAQGGKFTARRLQARARELVSDLRHDIETRTCETTPLSPRNWHRCHHQSLV